MLDSNCLLNVTNNQIKKITDVTLHQNFYLLYISPDPSSSDICKFKISSSSKNMTSLNTSIIFHNNIGYQSPIYGYPFKHCNLSYNTLLTDILDIITQDSQNNNKVRSGREDGICFCESNSHQSVNCSKTNTDNAIYPGQAISLPLVSTTYNLPVAVASYNKEGMPVCENVSYKICFPSPQLQMVYPTCTNLTYTIQSNSTDWCILCFKTVTQSQSNMLHTFNITLKECPLGLILYNGLCICDPKLQRAVKGLTCNPDGTFIRLPYTWISAIQLANE